MLREPVIISRNSLGTTMLGAAAQDGHSWSRSAGIACFAVCLQAPGYHCFQLLVNRAVTLPGWAGALGKAGVECAAWGPPYIATFLAWQTTVRSLSNTRALPSFEEITSSSLTGS